MKVRRGDTNTRDRRAKVFGCAHGWSRPRRGREEESQLELSWSKGREAIASNLVCFFSLDADLKGLRSWALKKALSMANFGRRRFVLQVAGLSPTLLPRKSRRRHYFLLNPLCALLPNQCKKKYGERGRSFCCHRGGRIERGRGK